jgi:hypothetical protein
MQKPATRSLISDRGLPEESSPPKCMNHSLKNKRKNVISAKILSHFRSQVMNLLKIVYGIRIIPLKPKKRPFTIKNYVSILIDPNCLFKI